MPSCIYEHNHSPWPTVGALVICPGERTCGYCTGEAALHHYAPVGNLRRHVVGTHTDGGLRDVGAVEVIGSQQRAVVPESSPTGDDGGSLREASTAPRAPDAHSETTQADSSASPPASLPSPMAPGFSPAPVSAPVARADAQGARRNGVWVSEAGKESRRRALAAGKEANRTSQEAKAAREERKKHKGKKKETELR